MAPPAGRRKVVLKKDAAAPPPGSVGRLNFVLAEAAFDVVGASEQEKADLAELKKQQFTLQRDPEAEARRVAAEELRSQREELTEEQRAKLEESRRRAQKRREKREAERKAAARREAQLQVYFRSAGRAAEAPRKAGEPEVAELQPPAAEEQELLPPILVGDALSLQGDLLAGLSEPSVLRKLRHLQRSLARRDPKGFASECQELVLKVQSDVLPKYGFSGDYEGIQNMLVAFEHPSIHRNPDFVKNSASLNQLLFGCSFTKDDDHTSLFEAAGAGVAEGGSPRRAEREAGQARLAEECRRQWGGPGAGEDRDAVGAYKSLAARFFAEEGDGASRDGGAGRREERSQLRLRREAASIIAGAGRRQAGAGSTGEDDEQRKFDGAWEDAEGTAVSIEGGRMRGPRDAAMDFVVFDGAKCSLRLGDSVYEGKFTADGRLLWKDGSMWVRKAAAGDEGTAVPVLVAAGEGGEEQPAPGGGRVGPAQGVTQALGGAVGAGGQAASPNGAGGGAGRGAPGGGTPGGGDGPDRPGGGGGGPGGGGGGDPGGDGEEDDWFEEPPPGRIFRQTLGVFHPPDDGGGNTRTIWKESGMPMIKSQFCTGGERAQRRTCYSAAAAAAHGAGGWALVEALREDVRLAVADRSATRFVEAMETLEKLFPEERHLKREVNSILSSLDEKDRKAAKTFIVQAMPYREKEMLEPGIEHYEVQSVFQEPSWYADWEVQPMWMWPLPLMFAMHQQCLLLKPTYTSVPHQWDFNQ